MNILMDDTLLLEDEGKTRAKNSGRHVQVSRPINWRSRKRITLFRNRELKAEYQMNTCCAQTSGC